MSYIEIPSNIDGDWQTTIFETKEEYREFVKSIFKEPGKYELDETSLLFNQQARHFTEHKVYTFSPKYSKDWFKYWGTKDNEDILSEKSKCRRGVIFTKGDKTWYLTRNYYFWINFLPIYDKEKKKFDFPDIWDSQYHSCLYDLLAELNSKHSAKLKKRQWGSTYLHLSNMINLFWFEDGATLKIGASLKDYINEKGAWKFLTEYRNFLNKHSEWYRGCDPDKIFMWQQRDEGKDADNKKTYVGNNSTITGHSFEKDETSGVGGNVTLFYHEEAGIAPKLDKTYEYLRPAMASGMITTGLFIAAGSVGDLSQCQPLKEMIMHPDAHSIYSVETNLLDDKGTWGKSGLFIPEQWSMPPFIDNYGNSLVDEALEAILLQREEWKKELTPALYQLRISQKPINIHEAFAYREESLFPLRLINKQTQRIEENEYSVEYVDLERDENGKVKIKPSNRGPILEFPIRKTLEDKTGVVCIYERPMEGQIPFGQYYASIDTVAKGRTTSSDSLCTIYVYKNPSEVAKIGLDNKIENRIDEGKIVLSWAGRYDDLNDTHELLEMIIDLYYAWTIVEKNRGSFIPHMINKKKQHLLVPTNMLLVFNRDLKSQSEDYGEYGWNNSKPVFQRILGYLIEFLTEVTDSKDISKERDNSNLVQTYGIERIPDIMALKEMAGYGDGSGNYDRIISLAALIAFVKIQEANRGFIKRIEKTEQHLEKSDKFRKFIMGQSKEERKPNQFAKPGNSFRHYK